MRKRILIAICIAICIFAVLFLLGSALVGFDVISANAGATIWLLGVIVAVIVFFKTKTKAD